MGIRVTREDQADGGFVQAFIVLQLSGGFAFAFIVLSALLFRGVKRHPIWFFFCVSWIVFGISFSLLSFAGQQHAMQPVFGLCVTQASLVYAAPFLSGSTSVALVIHLLLNIISALSLSAIKPRFTKSIFALIVTPWLLWIAVFIGVLVFGLHHSNQVGLSHNGTYCVLSNPAVPRITSVFATVVAILIIVCEVIIGILLFRNRAVVDILSRSIAMATRIAIFTGLGIAGAVDGLVFTSTKSRGVQFDLLIALIPPCAAIIFGTQIDLMRAWIFWRPNSPESIIRSPPELIFTSVSLSAGSAVPTSVQHQPNALSLSHDP